MRRSAVLLALLTVRAVVLGVGGPWALFSVCCCYSLLGARLVALLVFVRQSCWRSWLR